MSELQANPFDSTLATLKQDFPATFSLEVDANVFHDLPSLEEAHRISRAMENMKATAGRMGYVVTTAHAPSTDRWVYSFKLRPGFAKPQPDHVVNPVTPIERPVPPKIADA